MDALALGGDEGRSKAAKSHGELINTLPIRGYPNGETHFLLEVSVAEYIGCGGKPGELKHLSNLQEKKSKEIP